MWELLTKDEKIKDVDITENWLNIIETFSWMVPQSWEISENTIKLDDVYYHMTI